MGTLVCVCGLGVGCGWVFLFSVGGKGDIEIEIEKKRKRAEAVFPLWGVVRNRESKEAAGRAVAPSMNGNEWFTAMGDYRARQE